VNLPREEIHRVGPYTRRHAVSDVIATHLRRDSFATQRSLRRASGRWFELLPSVLPRLPAYMMERPLAADTHARRRVHLRATRGHPPLREGGMLVEPVSRIPKDSSEERARRHHPEVGPYGLVTPAISSKLERRLRARQSS
jgi:hypothetical protein